MRLFDKGKYSVNENELKNAGRNFGIKIHNNNLDKIVNFTYFENSVSFLHPTHLDQKHIINKMYTMHA